MSRGSSWLPVTEKYFTADLRRLPVAGVSSQFVRQVAVKRGSGVARSTHRPLKWAEWLTSPVSFQAGEPFFHQFDMGRSVCDQFVISRIVLHL